MILEYRSGDDRAEVREGGDKEAVKKHLKRMEHLRWKLSLHSFLKGVEIVLHRRRDKYNYFLTHPKEEKVREVFTQCLDYEVKRTAELKEDGAAKVGGI